MLNQESLDNKAIELEKKRILLLFKKENYNLQQKKWFIESKINDCEKNNDHLLLNMYKEFEKEITE